ncbi:MAG: hypothetical protein IT330_15065, partial [Anaerolineae bacterium]|nr:hypothetical protein [Anaerolineae bacterium]
MSDTENQKTEQAMPSGDGSAAPEGESMAEPVVAAAQQELEKAKTQAA